LKNGDLYILSYTNILYKSTDGGKSWIQQNDRANEHVSAVYMDNNGWFYKASMVTASNVAIEISKDNGATFTTFLNNSPGGPPYITNMSIQQDGLFYFVELSYSICRLTSLNSIDTYAMTGNPFAVYLVTKNNRFLYTGTTGMYYY
jgi:hypothetical protein